MNTYKREDNTAILVTINQLLDTQKIPDLDDVQMSTLLHYMFHSAPRQLRFQVAEAVYGGDRRHRRAFDLFLACVLPLAQRAAEKKASKIFVYPSDLQIELMYDGAVEAAITVFQRGAPLRSVPYAFRRYLLRALALGTVRQYFRRQENDFVRTVKDIVAISPVRPETIEKDLITRELLDKVLNYPYLPDEVRATLQCIGTLGPDAALKEHAYTPYPVRKREFGSPILNPDAIARARGIHRMMVHRHLRVARVILRYVFNVDGTLFQGG